MLSSFCFLMGFIKPTNTEYKIDTQQYSNIINLLTSKINDQLEVLFDEQENFVELDQNKFEIDDWYNNLIDEQISEMSDYRRNKIYKNSFLNTSKNLSVANQTCQIVDVQIKQFFDKILNAENYNLVNVSIDELANDFINEIIEANVEESSI